MRTAWGPGFWLRLYSRCCKSWIYCMYACVVCVMCMHAPYVSCVLYISYHTYTYSRHNTWGLRSCLHIMHGGGGGGRRLIGELCGAAEEGWSDPMDAEPANAGRRHSLTHSLTLLSLPLKLSLS